jgi:hypothetical protein
MNKTTLPVTKLAGTLRLLGQSGNRFTDLKSALPPVSNELPGHWRGAGFTLAWAFSAAAKRK